jgi:hypothetical protein
VEFLGSFIKPWRIYISRHSLQRIELKLKMLDFSSPKKVLRSINSYLGIFQHTASYRIRRRLFMVKEILRLGVLDDGLTKITEKKVFRY